MPFKKPHPYYHIWTGMKQRCNNPNAPQYRHYGGRGIKVCDRWQHSFVNFRNDMGDRPPGFEIDRIDVNGDYEPSNCRWITHKENLRNKRDTVYLTIDGERHMLAELSEKYKLKPDTIKARADRGLNFSDCVSPEKLHNLTGLASGGQASGAKKRAMTHCKHGHEFTPENTLVTKEGWRRCRECRNARQRGYNKIGK